MALPLPARKVPDDDLFAVECNQWTDAIRTLDRRQQRGPDKREPSWWIGYIVAAGPSAEADFTDDRYWVQRYYCDNDGGDETTDRNTFSAAVEPSDRLIVMAQNGCEYRCRGHMLTTGVLVQVWPIRDTVGVLRYMFWQSPGFAVYEAP